MILDFCIILNTKPIATKKDMKKLNTHFIKALILVFLIAINCNIFAQTADCDSPGSFSIVPVDNVGGTGTAADPYQVCSDSPLTVQSNGVNPNLSFPNPGLVFIVYLCDPMFTNPNDDAYNGDSGCFLEVTLADVDGSYIIDNGTARFNLGLEQWNYLGGLPLNVVIVPIILTDINDETSVNDTCSSIDLNGDYPHFVISNPLVNPDCGIDPTCDAEAGTISDLDEFYCDASEISPTIEEFNETADYVQVYVLTDEDLNILAVDTDAEFDLETGAYLFHALNVAVDEAPSDLEALIGLNAQDVLGGLDCFSLETSDLITVLEPLNISENDAECNNADNTITAEINISGGLPNNDATTSYTISGDVTGTADSDGLFTVEVENTVEEVALEVTDDAGCSSSITISFSALNGCVVDPTCDAEAGTISGLDEFYCDASEISPTIEEFNETADYVQVYVLTDEDLNILAVDTDAEFDLETGAYLFHALNVAVDEAPSDLEALIGLNAQDVLGGLDCFSLETSDLITVLEPLNISENDAECNNADNTITAEINISGGLPNNDATTSYTISGDVTGTADSDGLFTVEVENTVEEVALEVTDDAGCSSSITISFSALNGCVVDPTCDAEAGTISGLDEFYCDASEISPTIEEFNETADYVQVYVLTDEDLNILAVDTDAEFDLETGAYLFHALNVAVDEAPSDLEALIGLNAQDVLDDLDCFSLETSDIITVLEPLDYSIESIGCNAVSGLYDLVLTITGGLPSSDNSANYILEGDLSESVDADGVLEFSAEPSTAIEFSISDDEGCLINVQYDVTSCDLTPCDDLASGTISTNSETTICTIGDDIVDVVVVELDGSESNNFAYFITDADGLILDGPFDGPEFTFEGVPAGNCQIFGAAYEGSLNFTIGESILDASASECLALTNSIVITREVCYEDITIGDPIFEVDDSTGTYTITFGVFGGTGIYTGTNGEFDENIFNSFEFDCGDSATIVITDDAGNEIEITFEAPCDAAVECPGDSEAGTLSVSTTLSCANSIVTVGSTGFNSGAEYTQLYIATTGSDFIIAALSEEGMFDGLASGVYEIHALNYYNSNAPTLPNIGESAGNILNQTNTCFDLDVNDAITITILNPVEAVIDYSCNPETAVYTLTFSFKGGLPQYVAENGSAGITGETIYTVSGDLNGSFTYGENIVIDYTENTSYSMNFFDAFGCVGSASGTPSVCSKTAIELLVFDGEAKEDGNLIYWATASEYNSDYFVLEKSKDGITWEQIKSKEAAINSNQSISYEYFDTRNVTGVSYYRLISFDLYGQSDITKIVVVQNRKTGFEVESIYPIPAQNNISVNVYLSDYQEIKIELYSFDGKMMKQEIQQSDVGLNKINMDLSDFATGIYWIQISSKMESFSQKIIKAL